MPRYSVSLARAIHLLFEEYGELSPYEAYQELCVGRGLCRNYESVRVLFSILRRLGLIRVVDEEPSSRGGFPRVVYEATPGLEHHPCWDSPKCCYRREWCTPRQERDLWETGVAPALHKLVEKLREKGKL